MIIQLAYILPVSREGTNLWFFDYYSKIVCVKNGDFLMEGQVSPDCRYHKISRAWSKGFLCNSEYFGSAQDDRLIAEIKNFEVFKTTFTIVQFPGKEWKRH